MSHYHARLRLLRSRVLGNVVWRRWSLSRELAPAQRAGTCPESWHFRRPYGAKTDYQEVVVVIGRWHS
jgi:hypothetical protein